MPSAGITTLTTVATLIYNDTSLPGGCTTFSVRVPSDAGKGVEVNIPGLHEANEYFPMEIGQEIPFRNGHRGIKQVYAKGTGGATYVAFGVIAKTEKW